MAIAGTVKAGSRIPFRRTWWPFATVTFLLAAVFLAVAVTFIRRYSIPLHSAAGIYFCFVLLLLLVLTPGIHRSREAAGNWLASHDSWVLIPLWCLPYLVYAAGTGDFRWAALLRIAAVAVPVFSIYRLFPVRNAATLSWPDAFAAVALIAAVLSHQLRGIWNVPVNLDFMARLLLVAVGSWCWTFVRRVPDLGYEVHVSTGILKAAALNFALFALVAIPASLALRFTQWNPRWEGGQAFLISYLEIFLFVALLEELFFRGFLQTLLSTSLRSPVRAQLIVSALFGLFHILHAPFPNWRYVALATVAGWFYGSAFRAAGNQLMASATVHALVDTIWRTWMSRST